MDRARRADRAVAAVRKNQRPGGVTVAEIQATLKAPNPRRVYAWVEQAEKAGLLRNIGFKNNKRLVTTSSLRDGLPNTPEIRYICGR